MSSLLRLSAALLVLAVSLVTAQDGGVPETRQSEGNWLCAAWVPYGIQASVCRFYCFFFFNRLPSADTGGGCVNGSCDCS